SVVKLSIYLNKLYQDSAAVGTYFTDRDINYCIVSACCLFLPAILYIVYIVGAYIKDQEEAEKKEVGTKVVHGLLLVPWQIKGRVEVLQFSAQRVYGKTEYKALTGEIIASGLTLLSMMAAVRRKDDGILTGFLSIFGWMSIMISRSVAISLATTVIHGWMILVCIMHGVFISTWITSIAIKTYYEESPSISFTGKRKVALFFVIFSVFGLPSLTYWPIMFELKKHKRPLIFLFVLLVENVLFVALWMFFDEKEVWAKHDYVLVFLSGGLYILGALFVLFYICCKPKYTDHVVYHDMKVRNADSFGMYFDFCDVAFKLTRKQEIETKLKKFESTD
ncbi:XK-related protein, partial [Trichonephila inaurata madagascariensis]